ncbi:YitT family protein [Novosphingobium decolorationis]|uniref:YitT family protein n=1 Tax=Novosphingobium decolorationis TaxID=2698673 RepID=A0ABX8E5Z0_9SPHN|nr:YitT family protein [Novosphingobium decolorationis]QVM83989.1 YitT family protein [Novosphingobium decolorationis]
MQSITTPPANADVLLSPADARPHTVVEDTYAGVIACTFIAFGVVMLRQAGLVTGGMAGVALLLSYYLHYPATTLFAVTNIPFFWLAGKLVSIRFGLKTMVASMAIMGLGLLLPVSFGFAFLDPLFAAIFGGTLCGIGILVLARHGAGVGGVGVVALMLQRFKGWNAGTTQLVCDIMILSTSLLILDMHKFLLSLVSAFAVNGVMIVNHRPGRYIGH